LDCKSILDAREDVSIERLAIKKGYRQGDRPIAANAGKTVTGQGHALTLRPQTQSILAG
jgi:hypothetical protein